MRKAHVNRCTENPGTTEDASPSSTSPPSNGTTKQKMRSLAMRTVSMYSVPYKIDDLMSWMCSSTVLHSRASWIYNSRPIWMTEHSDRNFCHMCSRVVTSKLPLRKQRCRSQTRLTETSTPSGSFSVCCHPSDTRVIPRTRQRLFQTLHLFGVNSCQESLEK